MKTMKTEDSTPRALREVWEWKEAVRQDTVGLTTSEALKRIHAEAEAICRDYGLSRATPDGMSLRVAEKGADYGRKNDDKGESIKA